MYKMKVQRRVQISERMILINFKVNWKQIVICINITELITIKYKYCEIAMLLEFILMEVQLKQKRLKILKFKSTRENPDRKQRDDTCSVQCTRISLCLIWFKMHSLRFFFSTFVFFYKFPSYELWHYKCDFLFFFI